MSDSRLLSRDEFREGVFKRDNYCCVFCDKKAVDAHHIVERRLWPDGGYYVNNGASVCEQHHLECEMTIISVEQVREACGITKKIIPPHLYSDEVYDKWGNSILPNGQRVRGELFQDESVQKILARGGVLELFTAYVKYPRTHHLPWSPGMNSDDRLIDGLSAFKGERVIVTEKRDGENTTMYRDHIHARSVSSRHHWTQSWVKQHWSTIAAEIPEEWRICGENLYAKHSIAYDSLKSYFEIFSVWNEKNVCLSWDETVEWAELLGLELVPVLYDGIYDEGLIKELWSQNDWGKSEGYVVRTADEIAYGDFRRKAAKFVREGHVQTRDHWRYGKRDIEVNELAKSK